MLNKQQWKNPVIKYIIGTIILCGVSLQSKSDAFGLVTENQKLASLPQYYSQEYLLVQHGILAKNAEQKNDRNKPLYEVYKNGIPVEVNYQLQWYIRDLAIKYSFNEKIIYGTILAESTFNEKCKSSDGRALGLTQINKYWISTKANIPHFTDDYASRNLLDARDNLLTLMEIWSYARDLYNLDVTNDLEMKQLLYWHNTGRDPRKVTKWKYSDNCFKYASELVLLQE